jgi:hypothetical protein
MESPLAEVLGVGYDQRMTYDADICLPGCLRRLYPAREVYPGPRVAWLLSWVPRSWGITVGWWQGGHSGDYVRGERS